MIDLKITEVEHYTDRLFRIRTERPPTYRYAAGEFVMIGLEDTPKRAYSFTSGPYDEYLEFYSIKVPDGPLTSKLQKVEVGDILQVGEKPTGTLTLANLDLGGDLWMLATGTGIAPFISLLRDPTTFDHFKRVHVVWSVRNREDLASYHDFIKSSPVHFIPTITQGDSYPFQNKRITELLYNGKLGIRTGMLDKENTKVMICGNLDFNNSIADYFRTIGWEEGNSKTAGAFVQERAFVER